MIPNWYQDALAKMTATRRHAIVLVLPDDTAERAHLADAWLPLLESMDIDVVELLAEGLFIHVTPAIAKDTVRRPNEPANRFVLNPDGKVIAADVCNLAAFLAKDRFVRQSRRLLRGEGNVRLKAEAEKLRSNLTPAELTPLETHDASALSAQVDRIMPLLSWMRLSGKTWVGQLIEGGRVAAPVGMELKGQWTDFCPACGRGRTGPEARRFLTFLSGPSKETADGSFWQQTI
jgi:hypothetical protein